MAKNELNMSDLLRSADVNINIFDEQECLDFPVGFVVNSSEYTADLVEIEFLGTIFGEQAFLVNPERCMPIELLPKFEGFISTVGGYVGSCGVSYRLVRGVNYKTLHENFVLSNGKNIACDSVTVSLELSAKSPSEFVLESNPNPSEEGFDGDLWYPVKLKGSFGIGFGVFQTSRENGNATLRFVRSADSSLNSQSLIELFVRDRKVGEARIL